MIDLGEVSALSTALLEAERAVESAEAALKVLKERERKLREEDLPSAMEEVGLKKVVLQSGEEVTVKQEVYAAYPKAQEGRVFAWLKEHGAAGLIKNEVVVALGKLADDDEEALEKANALIRALGDLNMDYATKEAVHPQTMKAFIREQLESPEKAAEFPMELFGARVVNAASIKVPKSKK